jgi:hypothetical protein
MIFKRSKVSLNRLFSNCIAPLNPLEHRSTKPLLNGEKHGDWAFEVKVLYSLAYFFSS